MTRTRELYFREMPSSKRLSIFAVLLLAVAANATEHRCGGPLWTLDLTAKYGLRPFEAAKHPRNAPPLTWRTAQGVVFTSPKTLAIYQVVERENLPSLEPRDASGGGGNFALRVIFLDRATGAELNQLNLTTEGSAISGVYATHDGQFLVLTGEMLRVYSPKFQEIASRTGPVGQSGKPEAWNVLVIASGRRIFAYAGLHSDMPFLLDSDTLDTIPNPRPSDVALWKDGYRIFPELRGERTSLYSPEGQRLALDYKSKIDSCAYVVFSVSGHQAEGPRWGGCQIMRVFSPQGQMVWDVPMRGEASGFVSSGAFLATAFYRFHSDPFDLGVKPTPLKITIYDVSSKSEKCSIPITEQVFGWRESRYFDISPEGSLAVAQRNQLTLYEP